MTPHIAPAPPINVPAPPPLVVPPPPPPAPPPAPAAPAAPPHAAVITNPDWIHKPGADEFAQYYPQRAMELGKEGSVVISCTVTEKGTLTGCSTSEEDPPGFGFADAAVKISRYFKMKPKQVDGQSVAGGQFTTRIRFTLAG
jgi:protein TonB